MYFADLSTRCQMDHGPAVRAIGWLDGQHTFPTGSVPDDFLLRLQQHIAELWAPLAAGGWHECELGSACSTNPYCDGGNVWIPFEARIYVAPTMIVHYITQHGYQPPDEFINAVLYGPRQRTSEYRRLFELYSSHAEYSN